MLKKKKSVNTDLNYSHAHINKSVTNIGSHHCTQFKLNTDGSANLDTKDTGIGTVNLQGQLVGALAANTGNNTNNSVELWAIREGLRLAKSLAY